MEDTSFFALWAWGKAALSAIVAAIIAAFVGLFVRVRQNETKLAMIKQAQEHLASSCRQDESALIGISKEMKEIKAQQVRHERASADRMSGIAERLARIEAKLETMTK